MRLEEVARQVDLVMGQMNSIKDSLKILLELMAQITTLRKENGQSDVSDPSRTKASELGYREEIRAQERRSMGATFQEDHLHEVEMAEEF